MRNIKYYKIIFRLVSPLAVGSGEKSNTDSDVVLDSRGVPMIPATAFAGVIRHYLDLNGNNDLFGYVNGEKSSGSRIKFYDAELISDESFTTVRDSVALENKVGKKGAKFDLEAVESGVDFSALIELDDADENEDGMISEAISAIDAGYLRIGSKTSRGYGQLKVVSIRKAEFILPSDREKWLGFDPFDSKSVYYSDYRLSEYSDKFVALKISLKQKGAVSIRSYTVKNASDIESADYIQLSLKDGTPVIPGTSWAGAFRERFKKLSGDCELTKNVFGDVDQKKKTQKKSSVYFGESIIKNSVMKVITRNSIDRFSSGTKDGALYTERTCYNGNCELSIFIRKDISDLEKIMKLMSAVICDLDRGYLSVGGLTAVGRGMFSVEAIKVNGTDITSALKAGNISAMAQEAL